MTSIPRIALCTLGLLTLAACGGSGGDAAGGDAANSKVLAGSASDAMIAYDTVRSEPPPAKIEVQDGEGATRPDGESATAPSAEASAPAAEATPDAPPVSEPSPAAE